MTARTFLPFRLYRDGGVLMAATKYAEDAARLVEDGWTVHYSGHVLWREGHEAQPAGESYDGAAAIMYDRLAAARGKRGDA